MITSKGQGMTSDRTRSRMVEKLREEGIKNESVCQHWNRFLATCL